jgi:hypothetical protein
VLLREEDYLQDRAVGKRRIGVACHDINKLFARLLRMCSSYVIAIMVRCASQLYRDQNSSVELWKLWKINLPGPETISGAE